MSSYRTQAPYDFSKLYAILQRYPAPALFKLGKDGTYYRLLRQGNGALTLLRGEKTGGGVSIACVEALDEVDIAAVERQLATILGMNSDLSAFYEFAQSDPDLWAVVEPNYGLPIYRAESLYQALVFVIIEQHISWVAAQRAQQALVQWGNQSMTIAGDIYYAMPQPEQLAAASVDALKPLKITFRRMELLIGLSQQIVSGELDIEQMSQLSAQDLYQSLLDIKGIGHWTASVVVSRWLGQYDFVPHTDVALQAAVRAYFGLEKSAGATKAHFAQYGDFGGLAAHFTLMRWVLDEYPAQETT